MKKKVVILQEYVPQYRVSFFDTLADLASSEDIELVVAAGQPNGSLAGRGDNANPPYVLPIRQREFAIGQKRIVIRNVRKATAKADLVIMEQARRNLDAYRLLLPRFFRQRMWALWGHGRDYVEHKSKFSAWLQSVLTSRADWFFAYTSGGARHVEGLGFSSGKITTVMNSLDTTAMRQGLKAASPTLADFRSTHGLQSKIATFIGALDESKRISFLLHSLQRLSADHPNVSFVIAGDGPLRDKVRAVTEKLPNVHAIGRVDGEAKYALLSLSNVLLVPGRVGLIAVDSLAAGVPIVTTRWEYHAPEFEYLEEDVSCVCSDNSVEAYSESVSGLILDDERRIFLSDNCRSAGEHLSVEQMSRNFIEGVRRALAKGGRG
ncbi:glycosyltransferase family 4 protein [Arthrobacter globiformis]|uniref:glycosyltransferase family 4 protein n=1 Tax=Arthrobacter globiformis TaxID=1665 RepID=UPI000B4154D5|nr:glycosyltransferase family 4 protein [Arthrobacter globiformis]